MEEIIGQLVFEVVSIIVSLAFAVVAGYLKYYLSSNATAIKYNLYNERVERILENALVYSETDKSGVAGVVNKIAKNYIAEVAPDIYKAEGERLDIMLDRKKAQIK